MIQNYVQSADLREKKWSDPIPGPGVLRVRAFALAFFVSPGPFFLKRIGKLRIVTSLSEQTGTHLSTRGGLSARTEHREMSIRHTLNTAMFDRPACSPLARPSSAARSKASKPAALAGLPQIDRPRITARLLPQ